jgi:siroheme synthase-like protein
VSRPYPVLLELDGTPVLVVGGGVIAARRTAALVEAGARPVVISPRTEAALDDLAAREGLTLHRRAYRAGDARGFRIVRAATGDREVNAAVAADAAAAGAWVSVVDDPAASTLHLPAALRSGEVTVAVSTGGAAPLLARRLRDRLERLVTPGLGRASERLHALRARVRERWPDDESRRRAFWFALITDEFLDRAIEGRDEELENRIEVCLSQS